MKRPSCSEAQYGRPDSCLRLARIDRNRLLGTTQLNLRQFGWSLIPALALLVLWQLGKYVARR